MNVYEKYIVERHNEFMPYTKEEILNFEERISEKLPFKLRNHLINCSRTVKNFL